MCYEPCQSQSEINAVHVTSDNSGIADSISQKQWQGFMIFAQAADKLPIAEFLNLLQAKWIVYLANQPSCCLIKSRKAYLFVCLI